MLAWVSASMAAGEIKAPSARPSPVSSRTIGTPAAETRVLQTVLPRSRSGRTSTTGSSRSRSTSGIVGRHRSDQYHFVGRLSRDHRSQTRTTGPVPGPLHIDHRDGRLRAEPVGRAFDIDVEQGITDDHQRPRAHVGTPRASSSAMQRACTTAKWISCTVATVGASTGIAPPTARLAGWGPAR